MNRGEQQRQQKQRENPSAVAGGPIAAATGGGEEVVEVVVRSDQGFGGFQIGSECDDFVRMREVAADFAVVVADAVEHSAGVAGVRGGGDGPGQRDVFAFAEVA